MIADKPDVLKDYKPAPLHKLPTGARPPGAQRKFKRRMIAAYGGERCAVNPEVQYVDAAHLQPWDVAGFDWWSGLLLNPTAHRFLDTAFWAIDPETFEIVIAGDAPSPQHMGIFVKDITHLPRSPHRQIVRDLFGWYLFTSRERHEAA